MNLRLSLALSACGLAFAASGCMTPGGVTRAQSPDSGIPVSETGWNPHHFGGPGELYHEHMQGAFYGSETSYQGHNAWRPSRAAASGEQSARQMQRERRMMSRGILPPEGSPYAMYQQPIPEIDPNAVPDRTVDGVPVYDGYMASGKLGPCPHGCPPGTLCPHGYNDFWPGGCPQTGADYVRWMPTHHHTYAYERPRDLVYPSPTSVGGAVVYPYYTFKGPSDFFRK
jgi:hypothetical protein